MVMLRAYITIFKLPCIIIGLSLPLSSLASDYQDGLTAYMQGEFKLAQKHWLNAANLKDAKSMFNLGFLHEQGKLENATIEKALNWYRLSAENGYAPAGYHLAQRMLERGGSDDKAILLIRRAANAGYAPAKRYLGLNQAAASQKLQSLEPVSNDTSDASYSRFQSETWINKQRAQNWTIQLLAFKHKEQVFNFIGEHGLESRAAYFLDSKGGELFYKLVYGSFDSKDKASFARQNLPTTLQQHGPWLRTWASVQKITKQD